MRARSFQARLFLLMVCVLVLLQGATLIAVHVAGRENLRNTLAEELNVGSRVLAKILQARGRRYSETVRVLASDFAFREAIASGDRPTITSVLTNHGARTAADAVFLISLEGAVEADTLGGRFVGHAFPVPGLVARARAEGEAAGLVSLDGRPFQFVVVPVLAPQPIALVCIGFTIDSEVLEDLRHLAGLEVTLWSAGEHPRLISTLSPQKQEQAQPRLREFAIGEAPLHETIWLGDDAYESLLQSLPTEDKSRIDMLLQRSIAEAQRPLRSLELQVFGLSSVALLAALLAAVLFSRSISSPLRRLAEGAQRIERGDYAAAIEIAQHDEIGRLATAFNKMQHGISEREEQIRHQATHDGLTGLPNRTLFLDRLAHALAGAKRRKQMVGMVMMDLDRFKEVNDTLGHKFGDDLLVEFGRRLRQTIRESDSVARLGGDEFAVMFDVGAESDAIDAAHRISRALETPFALGGVSIDVKASMGIALYPIHAADADAFMKRADVAMYDAKRNHSSFAVYEPGRDEHSLRRLAILSDLRHAIASGELELHYQPKVELRTEKAIHAEALVRWRHPVHGMMPPNEFIPLAEQSGNIGMITKWVLKKAIADCAEWNRQRLELAVAVNLSVIDLHDEDLPTFTSGLLHDAGLEPSRLVLEITESAVMKDSAFAQRVLADLKARGIGLAIDDYGTGYSSLAHLKRLPVDELKIGKSFVVSLGDGAPEDTVIVRSTIELGHNMGLKVVAEGVENPEAFEALRRLGCDMAQGYYVSRPLAAAEFRQWMTESRWGAGVPAVP